MLTESTEGEQRLWLVVNRHAETENFRLNVTPRTLIESTHVKPESVDGSPAVRSLPLYLTKTISTDFERFHCQFPLTICDPSLTLSQFCARFENFNVLQSIRNTSIAPT